MALRSWMLLGGLGCAVLSGSAACGSKAPSQTSLSADSVQSPPEVGNPVAKTPQAASDPSASGEVPLTDEAPAGPRTVSARYTRCVWGDLGGYPAFVLSDDPSGRETQFDAVQALSAFCGEAFEANMPTQADPDMVGKVYRLRLAQIPIPRCVDYSPEEGCLSWEDELVLGVVEVLGDP